MEWLVVACIALLWDKILALLFLLAFLGWIVSHWPEIIVICSVIVVVWILSPLMKPKQE